MTAPTHCLTKDASKLEYITALSVPRTFARIGSKGGRMVNKAVIRNVVAQLAQDQKAPDLPVGLDIQSGTNGWVFNSIFRNFRMVMEPDRYWNGDGISTEVGCDGWLFEKVTVQDNQDGGFDLKAKATLKDCASIGNGRNFRFWNDQKLTGVTRSLNPRMRGGIAGPAHFHIIGPAQITIEHLQLEAETKTALFTFEGAAGARVMIQKWSMLGKGIPAGTLLQYGKGGSVDWGPQGPPTL